MLIKGNSKAWYVDSASLSSTGLARIKIIAQIA